MQKTEKIITILALSCIFCFVLASFAQATDTQAGRLWAVKFLENTYNTTSIPIWKITQPNSSISVNWVGHAPNLRFAIYDPGTPGDESDDLVLDKETGLVWERTPDTGATGWSNAVDLCYNIGKGRRMGWRLPTIEELASLTDPQQSIPPLLPDDHPFNDVQPSHYWSATTYESDNNKAWVVNMNNGVVEDLFKSTSNCVWCVRGGQGHDGW